MQAVLSALKQPNSLGIRVEILGKKSVLSFHPFFGNIWMVLANWHDRNLLILRADFATASVRVPL
jgi:hypothetical protein